MPDERSKPPTARQQLRRTAARPKTKLRSRIAPRWSSTSKASSRRSTADHSPSTSKFVSVVITSTSGRVEPSAPIVWSRSGKKPRRRRGRKEVSRATAGPSLLADPSPPFLFRTRAIRSKYGAHAVEIVRRPVVTHHHLDRRELLADPDPTASPTSAAALYAAMTTENVGASPCTMPAAV